MTNMDTNRAQQDRCGCKQTRTWTDKDTYMVIDMNGQRHTDTDTDSDMDTDRHRQIQTQTQTWT